MLHGQKDEQVKLYSHCISCIQCSFSQLRNFRFVQNAFKLINIRIRTSSEINEQLDKCVRLGRVDHCRNFFI